MALSAKQHIGATFGTRVVIADGGPSPSGRLVKVKCECGNEALVALAKLLRGLSKKCPECAYGKHYGVHQPFGQAVHDALKRCSKFNTSYRNNRYSGRGIKVCKKWVDNPLAFRLYLVKLWYEQTGTNSLKLYGVSKDHLSLDRIDNSKGYEPGNLKFSTKLEQQNNRG